MKTRAYRLHRLARQLAVVLGHPSSEPRTSSVQSLASDVKAFGATLLYGSLMKTHAGAFFGLVVGVAGCGEPMQAGSCGSVDPINHNGTYEVAITKTIATGACGPKDVGPSHATLVVSGVTVRLMDWPNAPCTPLAGTLNADGAFSASCETANDSASISGTVARTVNGTASVSVRREFMQMCDATFTVVSR